ncbi:MAG: hypothetical protein ABH886_04210 [Candidatus Desantisbacteria bacterium]
MMKKVALLTYCIAGILLVSISAFAEKEQGDWQDIRERLIRIEERMVTKEELKTEIKDVRSEIKDVRSEIKEFMLWGFSIIFAGIFSLVGFVLWDRRTTLAPVVRKYKEIEERADRLEKVLKEFAITQPRLAEGLRYAGFL